jgi:CheY-like chemotaxis protein
VLIVDDDTDVVALVREVLDEAGYAVASVRDGAAALALLTTYEPALILADLRMPVMDGWSFVGQYRRRGGKARIIVFTAIGAIAEHAQARGIDGVIVKPFDLDALVQAVDGMVRSAAGAGPVTRLALDAT